MNVTTRIILTATISSFLMSGLPALTAGAGGDSQQPIQPITHRNHGEAMPAPNRPIRLGSDQLDAIVAGQQEGQPELRIEIKRFRPIFIGASVSRVGGGRPTRIEIPPVLIIEATVPDPTRIGQ